MNALKIMKMLLDLGVDGKALGNAGVDALSIASSKGNCDAMRLLLDHNADVNAKGARGLSPLHIACRAKKLEALRMLLDHPGIDIEISDTLRSTVG